MDDDYKRPIVPVEHVPITPPRKGHIGEAAFLELWQRYVGRLTDEEIDGIFRCTNYRPITQRQASVAASFVLWLGTNCGRSLLHSADNMKRHEGYREGWDFRYLRQWELENRRESGINGGVRLVEAILWDKRNTDAQLVARDTPTITIDDLDVIDDVCRWLGTQDGQAFIRAADARVEAENRAKRLFGEQ